MVIREIACRSILTKSGIPTVDYAVNPYVGCEHGCVYCYAVFMKRFTGHKEEWGEFVDVRINAPQVLARQLKRMRPGSVTLGTVTDAYQPVERQYELTRDCLQALQPYHDFPTTVLTKSTLVLRDLDILRKMPGVEVAFTITTLDETVRDLLEPRASPIHERLEALSALHEAGIRTWVFFGPALPVLSDSAEAVDRLFAVCAEAGVARILVDTINLKGSSWKRLSLTLQEHYPQLVDDYRRILRDPTNHTRTLTRAVARAADRHQIPCDLAYR
jgi:DNA repair photolyase